MHTYNRKKTIERIKSLLKDNHITQDYLAEILDTYSSRVSDCMRNKKDFTTDQLFTIARHFNVSLDYLLGLNEDTAIAETKPDNQEISCLSDAIELLFKLFHSLLGCISPLPIPDNIPSERMKEAIHSLNIVDNHVYCIYFNNKPMQQFLSDYTKICAISDAITDSEPFRIWLDTSLNKYSHYKKEYCFLNFDTFKHNIYLAIATVFILNFCHDDTLFWGCDIEKYIPKRDIVDFVNWLNSSYSWAISNSIEYFVKYILYTNIPQDNTDYGYYLAYHLPPCDGIVLDASDNDFLKMVTERPELFRRLNEMPYLYPIPMV